MNIIAATKAPSLPWEMGLEMMNPNGISRGTAGIKVYLEHDGAGRD